MFHGSLAFTDTVLDKMDLRKVAVSDGSRLKSRSLFQGAIDCAGTVIWRNRIETNDTNRRLSAETRGTIWWSKWYPIMTKMTITHSDENMGGSDGVQWLNATTIMTVTNMTAMNSNDNADGERQYSWRQFNDADENDRDDDNTLRRKKDRKDDAQWLYSTPATTVTVVRKNHESMTRMTETIALNESPQPQQRRKRQCLATS